MAKVKKVPSPYIFVNFLNKYSVRAYLINYLYNIQQNIKCILLYWEICMQFPSEKYID